MYRLSVDAAMNIFITQSQIDQLLTLIRKTYPRWQSVDHLDFGVNEIDYKRKAAAQMQSSLSRIEFARLLDAGDTDEIVKGLESMTRTGSKISSTCSPSPTTFLNSGMQIARWQLVTTSSSLSLLSLCGRCSRSSVRGSIATTLKSRETSPIAGVVDHNCRHCSCVIFHWKVDEDRNVLALTSST